MNEIKYGINGNIDVDAARPITVESSTPIAIVATVDKGDTGFKKFNNADEGLEYIKTNTITDGTLENALRGINLQGVNCPIVCHLSILDVDAEVNKTNILAGLGELSKSEPITGINLRLGVIIAPEYSADAEIGAKIDSVATKLWCPRSLTDDFSSDEAGFKNYIANFGSMFLIHCTGRFNADGKLIPMSALVAGHIARWDAKAFGWAKSHSNRVVLGVVGTDRVIEYLDGSDCEARRLRQASGCMIVKDVGWRLYGFQTNHIDPIWQNASRVSTFYRLLDAILKASKWARDREADELQEVKDSVDEFMLEMKGAGVVLGFSAVFDERNTKATVTAGKFYLTIKTQDMPEVTELNIDLVYTDGYSDVLISNLNGGETA